uniref:Uncharacterized protein n=1 Tax=Tolypothrix bouteillei VB521301 TaxID=1479485 RepID=A0A0C1RCJ3_9CYAN
MVYSISHFTAIFRSIDHTSRDAMPCALTYSQYLCQNALTLERRYSNQYEDKKPGFSDSKSSIFRKLKLKKSGFWEYCTDALEKWTAGATTGGTQSSRLNGGNPPKFAIGGFPQ